MVFLKDLENLLGRCCVLIAKPDWSYSSEAVSTSTGKNKPSHRMLREPCGVKEMEACELAFEGLHLQLDDLRW